MSFPDLDPYETLNLTKEATTQEIKKSYRKLCLLYHPDKSVNLEESIKAENLRKFEEIQFAHSILVDEKKRSRYDKTGSFEEVLDSDGFDWMDYFNSVKVEINEENIAKDKKIYQGSEDEKEDIIESWIESKGDFTYLFESIPHTELTKEDESRLFDIVSKLIREGIIEASDSWRKYQKNRTKTFNKLLKSALKESKEAELLKQEILKKNNANSEDSLKQAIMKKRSRDMDSLISSLESKYGKKTKKGRGNKSSVSEPSDAEFEALQAKLFKK